MISSSIAAVIPWEYCLTIVGWRFLSTWISVRFPVPKSWTELVNFQVMERSFTHGEVEVPCFLTPSTPTGSNLSLNLESSACPHGRSWKVKDIITVDYVGYNESRCAWYGGHGERQPSDQRRKWFREILWKGACMYIDIPRGNKSWLVGRSSFNNCIKYCAIFWKGYLRWPIE